MSGCGIQHINKGTETPSTTIDLKITGVAAGLKYQVNEMALSTKKDGQPKPPIPLFGVYQLSLARFFNSR